VNGDRRVKKEQSVEVVWADTGTARLFDFNAVKSAEGIYVV
jgi:hypothetical protein